MTGAVRRKGWCPGALRPMATGDGLLTRLRVTGGILGFSAAHGVARCARAYGNGLIDLTARANLQVRGVTEASLGPLQAALDGLGLLDARAEAEAVRNVVASPLAGVDATALLDIRPVVSALEARLARDAALHALPPKFNFLVDDGGRLGLADVTADVRFEAVKAAQGIRFAIVLDGMNEPIGHCSADALPDHAARIAKDFLSLRQNTSHPPARLRDMMAATAVHDRSAGAEKPKRAGLLFPDVVAAAVPFGRLTADGLDALADAAACLGAQDVRLSPWRTIFIAHARDPHRLMAALAETGLIVDPGDPRLGVSACPGRPACARATTATHADATDLAALGTPIHVSGCAKGCGQTHSARFTLVGDAGRYDLVRDGTARDAPVERGLTLQAARRRIAAFEARP